MYRRDRASGRSRRRGGRRDRARHARRAGLCRQPAPARCGAGGADAAILQQVRDDLPLMPGLTSLVRKLQAFDWHVAIASGGFTYFADHLRTRLNLSAAVANALEVHNGRLTGRVTGRIVDAQCKEDTLCELAQRLNIPLTQTVAIGDGANDLKMIQRAGLGIAFHAKPCVYDRAPLAIRHADLIGVLCVLSATLKHEER
ncbi:phosphoserine phosphatase SerB [Edwardsiella piscicida]|uniref:phosphoserine phosphatase SerB n=1 Tax=Edwardsiella piscicida TaxID=1263550 RepID=UPI003855F9C3